MSYELHNAPWGYDVVTHTSVTPKPAPTRLHWHIGPVRTKTIQPTPGAPGTAPTGSETITMQLTADQQVELSISGEDAYGNPVDITGDTAWSSSDESIVHVTRIDDGHATASAVGPFGSAAVTVTNDVDADGSGDFIGSIAIDVVAGVMTEIVVTAGTATNKPA